jgi:uncharacterized RDD family membrane protein YckC
MEKDVIYAGFWIRAIADFIDSLILDLVVGLLLLMGLGVYYWTQTLIGTTSPEFLAVMDSFQFQVGFGILRCIVSLIYYPWVTYRYGTTLGKRAFKIYIVSKSNYSAISFQQSMVRCLSYALSYLPFGAGFLMVIFHPEKRALHDFIAGTVAIVRHKDLQIAQKE